MAGGTNTCFNFAIFRHTLGCCKEPPRWKTQQLVTGLNGPARKLNLQQAELHDCKKGVNNEPTDSHISQSQAPAVAHPAKDQPNPLSDEGLIQYLQRQVPENQKAVISTINKLESMCPHYHAMEELMGDQAFDNPLYKVDAQADNETLQQSTSEPAGNEIRSSDMESKNNTSDEDKGNQDKFQPSGQMNKKGRPSKNNNSTAIILDEEMNASSPEILPSNVIQDTNKQNKKQNQKKQN
ncbi:hypothetical protein VP01_1234g1 [Puccinia sorghi]|uniref:Uncharacterized protein n=1 Tax=Puccinia sorghi TaxID=27349 RepID=A0A0L6VPQ4_9BASI|nr:hypothetical protein VP01_1234g1 [Puccinia sorghi]